MAIKVELSSNIIAIDVSSIERKRVFVNTGVDNKTSYGKGESHLLLMYKKDSLLIHGQTFFRVLAGRSDRERDY